MIRTALIDDEKGVRNVLRKLLHKFCANVEIAGEAGSVDDGYKLILRTRPDLVFLDIQMPGGNGFELLEKFDRIDFKIVFITAYNEYALKAIKVSALDYLLKPVHSGDLIAAVDRYRKDPLSREGISTLLKNLRTDNDIQRIAVPSVGRIRYIDLHDIIRCESDGSYTHIYTDARENILSTKPLGEYEELLREKGFFRIHRSHLINIAQVVEYKRGERDIITLKDGSKIEVSRKKRAGFLYVMEKFNI